MLRQLSYVLSVVFTVVTCVTGLVELKEPVPVVYISYGPVSTYLQINIELAARNNPVVLITDSESYIRSHKVFSSAKNVQDRTIADKGVLPISIENMSNFTSGASAFAPIYKHLMRDQSARRREYELNCFKRWFVLRDFMRAKRINAILYGDGDSAIFANATAMWALRPHCDGVINIEGQGSNVHWVGAGEASLWSTATISDFCSFLIDMYTHHLTTLQVKRSTNVVDMSLLWLWWIAHKNANSADSWEFGKPYKVSNFAVRDPKNQLVRNHFDSAVQFTLKHSLGEVNAQSMHLCNGLDVVNRTVFDHVSGWQTGYGFTLNIAEGDSLSCPRAQNEGTAANGYQSVNQPTTGNNNRTVRSTGVADVSLQTKSSENRISPAIYRNGGHCTNAMPYSHAAVTIRGGRPESMDEGIVEHLEHSRLYFINIHYVGTGKEYVAIDICRILLLTGDGHIYNPNVAQICEKKLGKTDSNGQYKCQDHVTNMLTTPREKYICF